MATTILISNGFVGSAYAQKRITLNCVFNDGHKLQEVTSFSVNAILLLNAFDPTSSGPLASIQDSFSIPGFTYIDVAKHLNNIGICTGKSDRVNCVFNDRHKLRDVAAFAEDVIEALFTNDPDRLADIERAWGITADDITDHLKDIRKRC